MNDDNQNAQENVPTNSVESAQSAAKEKESVPAESAPAQASSEESQTPKSPSAPTQFTQEYQLIQGYRWDPFSNIDPSLPDARCINRIKKDTTEMYCNPVPGILVSADPGDVTLVHALITGPFSTPYEGGFFYFVLRFPTNYPFDPPKVKFMTTNNGTVRFNPNLYSNGKVCLSILGTWVGPKWLPSQTLSSVLLSIQSLLNDKPYHNEPGYENQQSPAVKEYNEYIQYQTMRVAVCNCLEQLHLIPKFFHHTVIASFIEFLEFYEETCANNLEKDGHMLLDPLFRTHHGVYEYKKLQTRLQALKIKYQDYKDTAQTTTEDEDDPDPMDAD